jgi:3-hydroxypropanoate dehydrogenase
MLESLDDRALDLLFRQARTFMKWQPRPVTDDTLRELYDLLKWGPTSANASPARFAFLRTKEAKERPLATTAAHDDLYVVVGTSSTSNVCPPGL